MAVDINTLNSLGLTQSSSPSLKPSETMGQDMFLKLMVTQLQNQNPLKPQDGAEFLSQLAQFSTVTGIQQLNDSFSGFSGSMSQNQALQAANLVGKNVVVSSSKAILGDAGIHGKVSLSDAADQLKVTIIDGKGRQVANLNLGAHPPGDVTIDWNGMMEDGVTPAPAGVYTIKAEALSGGKTEALETFMEAPVDSVTLGGANGIEVDLGVLGKHGLKDILEVL